MRGRCKDGGGRGGRGGGVRMVGVGGGRGAGGGVRMVGQRTITLVAETEEIRKSLITGTHL